MFSELRGRKNILLIAAFLVVGMSLKAQEVKPLTLQEAITLSLNNSHRLKASEARTEQADAAVQEARDNRLPNASVSGSYLRLAHPNIALKTKAFNSGGDTSTQKTQFPSVNQAMYGIANISYPIFAGGKIKYGIESAKYLQQATLMDEANDKEAIILNTINAYINLYKAVATVKVVNENLSQSQVRDSVFSRLEQNGILARNDLLKAELQTSNISLSLLDAENNNRIAIINMNLLLGLPENTILQTDSSSFERQVKLKTIDDYEQMALQNRKDLQALNYRQKAAHSAIDIAKADKLPTIALTGGYVAANIPKALSITNAINVGFGLKYDIASLWKNKAKTQQAYAREKELMANEAQLDDDVKLQVNRDYENYLLAIKKIEVYKKAVQQSQENYRITKNKYDNALVNTTDLLDANVLLLQSTINLAVAKADVYLAYNKLLQTTGTLCTSATF